MAFREKGGIGIPANKRRKADSSCTPACAIGIQDALLEKTDYCVVCAKLLLSNEQQSRNLETGYFVIAKIHCFLGILE
jgi:hypothetical protein